jgi:hypothetical protein
MPPAADGIKSENDVPEARRWDLARLCRLSRWILMRLDGLQASIAWPSARGSCQCPGARPDFRRARLPGPFSVSTSQILFPRQTRAVEEITNAVRMAAEVIDSIIGPV